MPPLPKLTNRGAAGLLTKLPKGLKVPPSPPTTAPTPTGQIDNIASGLLPLAVRIDSLKHDPNNARLHPERNMEAIKGSLAKYGQVKPIVVQRSTRTVMAGNGTMQAARELGWTMIAANFVDMTDAEAAGFGLADNRTAELAKWDFEVVARLDKLYQHEEGYTTAGWSLEELAVLRNDWTQFPPEGGTLDEHTEPEEVEEQQPGDGEYLARIQVTLEPRFQALPKKLYRFGKQLLLTVDPINDKAAWWPIVEANPDMVFAPYPGPLLPHTEKAQEVGAIMIQPDLFIASHIVDYYGDVFNGEIAALSCEDL